MRNDDSRIPVALGHPSDKRPSDLVLPLPAAGHRLGCRCCGGRDPLAAILSGAFIDRVRGTAPLFDRVLLLGPAGEAARVAGVLAADPVTQARFRAEQPVG